MYGYFVGNIICRKCPADYDHHYWPGMHECHIGDTTRSTNAADPHYYYYWVRWAVYPNSSPAKGVASGKKLNYVER